MFYLEPKCLAIKELLTFFQSELFQLSKKSRLKLQLFMSFVNAPHSKHCMKFHTLNIILIYLIILLLAAHMTFEGCHSQQYSLRQRLGSERRGITLTCLSGGRGNFGFTHHLWLFFTFPFLQASKQSSPSPQTR